MSENKTEIIIVENEDRQSRLANLNELLNRRFIIPLFQRQYAWNEENFKDLFETIRDNEKSGREAFFGSVIVAQKEEKSDIGKTFYLIDGQQRLTSFLMVLKFFKIKLEEFEEELERGLEEESNKIESAKKQNDGDGVERHTNNMRDIKDIRIKCDGEIKKINRFLKKRIERAVSDRRGGETEAFVLEYVSSENDISKSEYIRKIKDVFDEEFSDDNINETLNLLDFILGKCTFCFLLIKGDNAENHAVDIFNSLNSTGEPLTAFEILKSSLYKEDQNLSEILDKIEKDMQNNKMKRIKQNKYTDRLLIFENMMIEKEMRCKKTGTFSEKRKVIEGITDGESTEASVKRIKALHDFIIEWWENKRDVIEGRGVNTVESKIMFSFLRDIGHDRTLPVLFRFKDEKGFNEAVRACVAFTCLWRGYSDGGGTDRIDDAYQKIIQKIFDENIKNIAGLKGAFVETLKDERERAKNNKIILKKEVWIKKFKGIPIYKKGRVARLLLFIAFHKRDFKGGKLNKSSREFLTTDHWFRDNYRTIEHITPQNPSESANSRAKDHRIGNLILLPKSINSRVSNAPFLEKKKVYQKCIDSSVVDDPFLPILGEVVSYGEDDLDEDGYLSENAILTRGERLAESIWQALAVDILGWEE